MQNKQRITEFGLALIATVCVGSAAAAPLDPQKFVAGWPLDVTGEETFYDLTLTHEAKIKVNKTVEAQDPWLALARVPESRRD